MMAGIVALCFVSESLADAKHFLCRHAAAARAENKPSYVHGDDGGFFFTWMPTLDATLDSVEEDEVDGDGGLTETEVKAFLRAKIGGRFEEASDDVTAHDEACYAAE